MEINYDGHVIKVQINQVAETERWSVKINVSWNEGDQWRSVPLIGPKEGFPSATKAEEWEMKCSKQWIDDGKPHLKG